jgi:hypothetical protein
MKPSLGRFSGAVFLAGDLFGPVLRGRTALWLWGGIRELL